MNLVQGRNQDKKEEGKEFEQKSNFVIVTFKISVKKAEFASL